MQQARQALEKGDTRIAENLFQEILDKAQTQVETGAAHGAEAAYQLGELAESRIDYLQAQHYYQQAANSSPIIHNISTRREIWHTPWVIIRKARATFPGSAGISGKKSLGPEHPDVANSLNNLAALYASPGEICERRNRLYQRVPGN